MSASSSFRRFAAVVAAGTIATTTFALSTAVAAAETTSTCPSGRQAVVSRSYVVTHRDGTTWTGWYLDNNNPSTTDIRPGDAVRVTFRAADGCTATPVGLASYRAKSATFNPNEPQSLFDSHTGTFAAGTHTLQVDVPMTAADGSTCPNKHQDGPETKGKGANTSGAYDSTCDGSPSQNGNGDGKAKGKPCAGCVGNADDKNPPGQRPDGSDANNGYECDGNNGVGKSNPAHSGCKPIFFQVDFFVGDVLPVVDGAHMYGPRLIDAYNGPKS